MLNLRPARPEENEKIYAFFNAVIDALSDAPYSPGWERDIYPDREMLEGFAGRGEMYIGEAGGNIACAVALNAAPENAAALEIHLLAVHPDFRGKGLGRAMVRFAMEKARQTGMQKICLDVTEGNLPAERLYTSMGFVYQKSRRDWYTESEYMDFREFEYGI